MYDVIVIGAGASGLVSAIVLARANRKVLILEKNSKIGKKLLATGNGRCNITNIKPTPNRFHSKNSHLIPKLLNGYSYHSIKEFFKSIGLELTVGKDGKVFPLSLQASTVVELLEYTARELNVDIVCDARVTDIFKRKKIFTIIYNGSRVNGKKVVVATGSLSAPQLGGSDDGLKFAKSFGHRVVKTAPSLVQLTSSMRDLKKIAGLKIEGEVTLKRGDRYIRNRGDILFTKYGISGLAILDISREVVEELKCRESVTLTLDLMPKIDRKQLISLMRKSIRKKGSKPIDMWLKGFINKRLIATILESLKLNGLVERDITIDILERIAGEIKSFKFIVDGDNGYRGAEVASGGVDISEIEPNSMESKRVKGLHFTGEVLDIDGDRGGFNLHFAWVSALKLSNSIE